MTKNFYYLVNRRWFDKVDKQKPYCVDEVIHIYKNEQNYVDSIKQKVFTFYQGLPMKNLCCKDFIGLTISDVGNIGNFYKQEGTDPGWAAKVYKENDNYYQNHFGLIKYGNIFDESVFNEDSKLFIKNNIIDFGNGFGQFFDIPLIKDMFGNWVEWRNQAII